MYKVKRFSKLNESEVKNSFVKFLPKSWIAKNGFEVDVVDDLNLTESSIRSICNDISNLSDRVKRYEKEEGEYGMYSQVDDFDKLIDRNSCYIFSIEVDKKCLTISFSSRKFEDWMGWYNAIYSLPSGKFEYINYND